MAELELYPLFPDAFLCIFVHKEDGDGIIKANNDCGQHVSEAD